MSDIRIIIEGHDYKGVFYNDWDMSVKYKSLHIEDLEGFYGGVGASLTPELKRFRTHGYFPAPSIRGPRKMDLILTWHRDIDPSMDGYNSFARFASGTAWGFGTYAMTVTVNGKRFHTEVQLGGEPQFAPVTPGSEDAFRIKIPLTAIDPFLYGDTKQVTTKAYSKEPILLDPFFITDNAGGQVMAWDQADPPDPQFLKNQGNADAYPVVVVTADAPEGVSINIGGSVVTYRGSLTPQSPLTIDMKGRVYMNGVDRSYLLTRRDWAHVGPGQTVIPVVTFINGGTGYATTYLRDTYI